jgi:hypothetical protein
MHNFTKIPKKGKIFFGNSGWTMIHFLCLLFDLLYDNINKEDLISFLLSYARILGCQDCSKHFLENLFKLDFENYINNRNAFLLSYKLHDKVNLYYNQKNKDLIDLGKLHKKSSPPLEKIKRYYKEMTLETVSPHIWTIIHYVAAAYNPINIKYMSTFLISIGKLYENVCAYANKQENRVNFSLLLTELNFTAYLKNNYDCFFFSYLIHSKINELNNKQSPIYDDVKSFYFYAAGESCLDCKVLL